MLNNRKSGATPPELKLGLYDYGVTVGESVLLFLLLLSFSLPRALWALASG